jgi:hypothetical protein
MDIRNFDVILDSIEDINFVHAFWMSAAEHATAAAQIDASYRTLATESQAVAATVGDILSIRSRVNFRYVKDRWQYFSSIDFDALSASWAAATLECKGLAIRRKDSS